MGSDGVSVMLTFKFLFDIEPLAKGRPRISTRGGSVRAYTPTRTRIYETLLRRLAKREWGTKAPLTGPIEVYSVFFLSKGKSVTRKYPSVRPDADNYLKALYDALNGVVWKDDAQIVKAVCEKQYSFTGSPWIRVHVTQLD